MRNIAMAAVCCALAGASATAQNVDKAVDKRVGDYLRSAKVRGALASAIQQQTRASNPDCKDVKIASTSQFSILKQIEFGGANGAAKEGNWIESVKVTSCGVERRHNIQTVIVDGKIKMLAKMNGSSIANAVLQRDAATLLPAAVKTVAGRDCEKPEVVDTEFTEFQGEPVANAKDGPKSRVWREEWRVKACGKEVSLPIVFTPTSTGTSIAVKSTAAKEIE
jgi:hypothetical protein